MDHLIVLTRGPLKTTAAILKPLCFQDIPSIGLMNVCQYLSFISLSYQHTVRTILILTVQSLRFVHI